MATNSIFKNLLWMCFLLSINCAKPMLSNTKSDIYQQDSLNDFRYHEIYSLIGSGTAHQEKGSKTDGTSALGLIYRNYYFSWYASINISTTSPDIDSAAGFGKNIFMPNIGGNSFDAELLWYPFRYFCRDNEFSRKFGVYGKTILCPQSWIKRDSINTTTTNIVVGFADAGLLFSLFDNDRGIKFTDIKTDSKIDSKYEGDFIDFKLMFGATGRLIRGDGSLNNTSKTHFSNFIGEPGIGNFFYGLFFRSDIDFKGLTFSIAYYDLWKKNKMRSVPGLTDGQIYGAITVRAPLITTARIPHAITKGDTVHFNQIKRLIDIKNTPLVDSTGSPLLNKIIIEPTKYDKIKGLETTSNRQPLLNAFSGFPAVEQ